eukprot:g2938.t1
MDKTKTLESSTEGTIPSAPPLPVSVADDPLSQSQPGRSHLSRDVYLVRDLLRKAAGDVHKVANWLAVMGESVTAEELRNEVAQSPSCQSIRELDDLDAAAAQLGAPKTYFCPISYHLFRDPVLLQTGQTYERSAIERWLAEGGSICPITGVELPRPVVLSPNVALRQAIEDWALSHANWMLGPDGKLLPLPETQQKHFSPTLNPSAMETDGDTALAIRLQEEEINRQSVSGRHQRRQEGEHGLVQNSSNRLRRCVHLLFFITVLHFGMFLITLSKGDWEFEKIDSNPLIGFSARVINRVGGTDTSLISDKNEWWRIITSSLMTAGIIHLQWIISCLWTFGRFLATKMSFLSLALLYTVSCIFGVLLSANFSTTYVTAGASGGAFGLIGAVLVEVIVNWKDYRSLPFSLLFLTLMAGVGVMMGLTPMVDNWTNLGGLVAGIVTAMALRLTHRGLRQSACCIELGMIIIQVSLFLFMALLLAGGVVGLFVKVDERENCKWCEKLACVSTSWWSCDVARILPQDCAFDIGGDLMTKITCPNGDSEIVQLNDAATDVLEEQCKQVCDLRRSSTSNGETGNRAPNNSPGSTGEGGTSVVISLPPSDTAAILALENGNVRTDKTA